MIVAIGSDSSSGERNSKAEVYDGQSWQEISPYPNGGKLVFGFKIYTNGYVKKSRTNRSSIMTTRFMCLEVQTEEIDARFSNWLAKMGCGLGLNLVVWLKATISTMLSI